MSRINPLKIPVLDVCQMSSTRHDLSSAVFSPFKSQRLCLVGVPSTLCASEDRMLVDSLTNCLVYIVSLQGKNLKSAKFGFLSGKENADLGLSAELGYYHPHIAS